MSAFKAHRMNAMSNAGSAKESLKGFISKIEDWHRMMNFLEVGNI